MEDKIERAFTKMFMKTGDPFYFTARGIYRERIKNGGSNQGSGNSSE